MKKPIQFLAVSSLALVSCLSFTSVNAERLALKSKLVDSDVSHNSTRQLYWHESTFNASIFCDSNYVEQLVESDGFIVSNGVGPTVRSNDVTNDPYRVLASNLYAYSPQGACIERRYRKENSAPRGLVSFDLSGFPNSATPTAGDLASQIASSGSGTLLLMEDFAMQSSEAANGAQVEARIAFRFPYTRKWNLSDQDSAHDFSIYYMSNNDEWVLSKAVTIKPGHGRMREIILRTEVPYSTVVQARLTTRYTKPIYRNSSTSKSGSPSPKVERFSLLTETCVPDVINEGSCL